MKIKFRRYCFCSLFQLPENKIYRNIYKNIIKRKKKNFFSVENYKIKKMIF